MLPVGSAEGIVDINVCKRRQLFAKLRVVCLLFLVKAQVFQKRDVARVHPGYFGLDLPTMSDRRLATGASEYCLSHPSGLPRWDASITLAPRFARYSIVGRVMRIL